MRGPFPRFSGNVTITQYPDNPELFKVKESFLYRSLEDVCYCVLPGWLTDGGSIPRLMWRVLGPPIRHPGLPAFILHDILYKSGVVSRKKADDLLLEALEDCGVGWLKRWAIYSGVRIGGQLPYEEESNEIMSHYIRISDPCTETS